MRRAIKKEHCPHCDTVIEDVEEIVDTDVTNLNQIRDEPWKGTYYLSYKICPKCGEKVSSTEWWSTSKGYDTLREKTK